MTNNAEKMLHARALDDLGMAMSETDLDKALAHFFASRDELLMLGLNEHSAAVLMNAVSAARSHGRRELAVALCQRAALDDPGWADPLATSALVEVELGDIAAKNDTLPRAVLLYGRAARHHRRAAKLYEATDPEAARIERKFESYAFEKRKLLTTAARNRRSSMP